MIFSLYSVRGFFLFFLGIHSTKIHLFIIAGRSSTRCFLFFFSSRFSFFFARTRISLTHHDFLLWLRLLYMNCLFAFRSMLFRSVGVDLSLLCVLLLPFLVRAYLRLSVRKPQKHVWFEHKFFSYIFSFIFVNVFSFNCFTKVPRSTIP